MKMIDANELLNELEKVRCLLQMNDNTQRADLIMSGIYVAKRHIQEMPTVDIIRCKDCKAYNGMKCVRNNMIAVRADDYCSRAEQKQR